MKKTFGVAVAAALFAFPLLVRAQAPAAKEAKVAAAKTCTWSDEAKLRTHFEMHVTYPATGTGIKEACRKEMPTEFTKEERACFEAKIADKTQYANAGEVLKTLGVK